MGLEPETPGLGSAAKSTCSLHKSFILKRRTDSLLQCALAIWSEIKPQPSQRSPGGFSTL
jgi:hypothetical protein